MKLSDFQGRVRIVNFWATWCPPCRKEIPDFQALYEAYRDSGLTVIGISLDRAGVEPVRHFVREYDMTYPALLGDGQVSRAYGNIASIPTTFVIDRRGRVYAAYVGYRSKAVFEADIKKLLGEEA